MIKYEFEMLGEPIGKARPRMNTKTGKAYTPNNTKNFEYCLRQCFVNAYPSFKPIADGNKVRLSIIAYLSIPASESKKKKIEMINNIIAPTKKPDIDNITKIVLDALNKFAFQDDKQVIKLDVEKRYSEIPRIYVLIEEF